ncbi:bacteriohemerythrin [Psychromonas sp. KJ10-10]|uniref:GGDEF domain-containing protein n=1 Tax=Psychromonas sp. KJ10-10 TaxID=3391823 RepID=UPI0039B69276
MESFHWDEHFLTGIPEVDEQHHRLVDMINHFSDMLANDDVLFEEMKPILEQLNQYADYHFQEEEALMREVGIEPLHLNYHMVVHREFMNDLKSMHAGLSKENFDASKDLLNFLINWLAYHILGIDQNMARQVFAIKSGMDAHQAYQIEEKQSASTTEPLVATLSNLFKQVSDKNRELKKLNQSLEEKVKERTKELLVANQHLEEISLTDALTELPNRRKAMRCLSALWQESVTQNTPLVCMMIDADHFKQVNDTYGHDAGDEVLIELAKMLKHTLRNDDIVCRLGGDEFLVICPNTDFEGGISVAEFMRQQVSELRVETGGEPWKGSISIGVVARTADLENYEALIKLSDQGVYKSKQKGKNCVSAVSSSTC